MGQYIVKRLLLMIPTLFGITLLTFLMIRLAPGDPVAAKLGVGADQALAGEGSEGNQDRERQILKAKVRLGLMQEGGTLRLWNAAGDPREQIDAHEREVRAVVYSADGSRIATGSADGGIGLWDSASGRKLFDLPGHSPLGVNDLAFHPQKPLLVSVSDDTTGRVWDLETREQVREFRGHELLVRSVAVSPDGTIVATGSRDRDVRLWDLATGVLIEVLEGHVLEVSDLCFSHDGSELFSASLDRTIVRWDVASRRRKGVIPGIPAAVYSLDLSPNGDLLAAGLGNNEVILHDLATNQRRGSFSGHISQVRAVAFFAAGRLLISGADDKTVRVWDREREEVLGVVRLSSPVSAIADDPEGNGFATGSLEVSKVPLVTAYVEWVRRLVFLDLGRSFKDGRPVKDKILEAMPITLKLNITSILLTYLFSIPIGVYAATRRGRFFDQASSLVLFVLYSMPSFWVATMLIVLVGSPKGPSAQWFDYTLPVVGLHSDNSMQLPFTAYAMDHLKHLILPLTALTYGSFAFLSRLARNGMLEVLSEDYVRTAHAKGVSPARVVGVHAFRNSLISIVTLIGNLLPVLIGGSVIIEYIFSIPGMGALGFDAILQRDYPVIMAITTFSAVLVMLGILVSDILYCIVDPRIQLK